MPENVGEWQRTPVWIFWRNQYRRPIYAPWNIGGGIDDWEYAERPPHDQIHTMGKNGRMSRTMIVDPFFKQSMAAFKAIKEGYAMNKHDALILHLEKFLPKNGGPQYTVHLSTEDIHLLIAALKAMAAPKFTGRLVP